MWNWLRTLIYGRPPQTRRQATTTLRLSRNWVQEAAEADQAMRRRTLEKANVLPPKRKQVYHPPHPPIITPPHLDHNREDERKRRDDEGSNALTQAITAAISSYDPSPSYDSPSSSDSFSSDSFSGGESGGGGGGSDF